MLFRVGLFDDGSGEVVAEVPVCIGKAHELVAGSRVVNADKLRSFDDPLKEVV